MPYDSPTFHFKSGERDLILRSTVIPARPRISDGFCSSGALFHARIAATMFLRRKKLITRSNAAEQVQRNSDAAAYFPSPIRYVRAPGRVCN